MTLIVLNIGSSVKGPTAVMLAIWICRREAVKCFLLSKKVKVLYLIRKEKKSYAEVAEAYGKSKSPTCDTVKKKKERHASIAVALQTTMATVCAV